MSADWHWEYDPDHDHVAGGIPAHVITEVERLACQLVDLASTGIDVSELGNGPRHSTIGRAPSAGSIACGSVIPSAIRPWILGRVADKATAQD
ncbi:hypothetical protein [Streptomyces sp. SD15]